MTRPHRMLNIHLAAWLIGLLACAVRADDPKPKGVVDRPPALSAEDRAKNIESFEVVWSTIRDKHYDPTLGGLDWKAVHDELLPKVEKAESKAEARAAMTEALDRLHLTHFGIIAQEVAVKVDEDDHRGGFGETGIDVRTVDGKAVVTALAPDSPALKAGIKMGWIVEKIRDKPVEAIMAKVEKAYAKSGMLAARKSLAVLGRLRGDVGETVAVDFLDGQDKPVHVEVPLVEPRGIPAQFSNLGVYHVIFTSKRIDGTVGYVALNVFFDPVNVIKQFAAAIKEHGGAEGIIVDLRGNPGGIALMSMGMGGWFVNEPDLKLGTMITRDGSLHFVLNPRPGRYKGPVAVLVDEMSMSTSEIFAGGLKDLKRARIFGVKTPGAALPSRVDVLPNGDRFQYAFANYISSGGKPLEGFGVVPDTLAPLTRAALLAGHDPAIDAAVLWIRSQKTKP
jgi:carboxyl-terminal processing protease